jgi:hypothetical protein
VLSRRYRQHDQQAYERDQGTRQRQDRIEPVIPLQVSSFQAAHLRIIPIDVSSLVCDRASCLKIPHSVVRSLEVAVSRGGTTWRRAMPLNQQIRATRADAKLPKQQNRS